jgi:flagellar motor protein MotB
MRRLGVLLLMAFFVWSVSGLSFAQTPSATALEKASDNAKFKRGEDKTPSKPDVDKVKTEKEKAVKEKAGKEKAAKEKEAKEKLDETKADQEKAGKAKVKTEKEKMKPKVEEVKKQ